MAGGLSEVAAIAKRLRRALNCLYAYVGGNPVSLVDPLGWCPNQNQSPWSLLASSPGLLAIVIATEVAGGGPEDPLADVAVAAEIAEAEAAAAAAEGVADTVTVGRWMSQAEASAMQDTGLVQESFNNGVTSVTLPPNPAAYANAPAGDIFVQFDVPQSAIGASDGTWAKIFGPNSIFGPVKGITQMPPATNIVIPGQ